MADQAHPLDRAGGFLLMLGAAMMLRAAPVDRRADEGQAGATTGDAAAETRGTAPVTAEAWTAASNWAMAKLCAEKGFSSKGGICFHTQASCAAGPGKATKAEEYGEWADGKCVAHDQEFKKWCVSEKLTAHPSSTGVHTCVTNNPYCSAKGVSFSGGDCRVPPGQWVAEAILGTTLTRGLRWIGENPERAVEEGARLAVDGVEYVAVDSVYRPLVDPLIRGDVEEIPGNVYGVTKAYTSRIRKVATGAADVAAQTAAGLGGAADSLSTSATRAVLGDDAADLVSRYGPGKQVVRASETASEVFRRIGGADLEGAADTAVDTVGDVARGAYDSFTGLF